MEQSYSDGEDTLMLEQSHSDGADTVLIEQPYSDGAVTILMQQSYSDGARACACAILTGEGEITRKSEITPTVQEDIARENEITSENGNAREGRF